ncbi:hypothetical protein CUS71_14105 [Enterococcus faecalis]|uniref:hypothetical protein n=1 Tax=Enterococcus faecalis TaxID=1351 RepID=UPI000CF2F4FA|nr:hypothetical protein [Enterococcus faecalis]PQF44997.1 hypothetical protein CUS71_14105 [Enterococcus faecalis]
MRRIEKEFNKKLAGYERELKKLGCLDDETGLIPISKRRWHVIWGQPVTLAKTIVRSFRLTLDNENLCILGDVEITIYHDGTYGISKEAVPIFINDLLSLKKLITIFYGTPFNLNFEKIRCVNFNRYCVTIPEIYVEKFEVLINYLIILSSCLHEVKKHVEYD